MLRWGQVLILLWDFKLEWEITSSLHDKWSSLGCYFSASLYALKNLSKYVSNIYICSLFYTLTVVKLEAGRVWKLIYIFVSLRSYLWFSLTFPHASVENNCHSIMEIGGFNGLIMCHNLHISISVFK